MKTVCLMPTCNWTGPHNDLLNHCNATHPTMVKVIEGDGKFSFTHIETAMDVILLQAPAGLYWFLFNPYPAAKKEINRGIFAVEGSQIYNYTVKVGRTGNDYTAYIGPCQTQTDYGIYDIHIPKIMLESTGNDLNQNCIEVYFGDYQDLDVHYAADVTTSSTVFDNIKVEKSDTTVNKQTSQISMYPPKPAEKRKYEQMYNFC